LLALVNYDTLTKPNNHGRIPQARA